jgi:hypothetical protein
MKGDSVMKSDVEVYDGFFVGCMLVTEILTPLGTLRVGSWSSSGISNLALLVRSGTIDAGIHKTTETVDSGKVQIAFRRELRGYVPEVFNRLCLAETLARNSNTEVWGSASDLGTVFSTESTVLKFLDIKQIVRECLVDRQLFERVNLSRIAV